jgi:hypothetical protein
VVRPAKHAIPPAPPLPFTAQRLLLSMPKKATPWHRGRRVAAGNDGKAATTTPQFLAASH